MAAEFVTLGESLNSTLSTMGSMMQLMGFVGFILSTAIAVAKQSAAHGTVGLLLLSSSFFLPALMGEALQEAEKSKPNITSPHIAEEITQSQYVDLVKDLQLLRTNSEYANTVVSAKIDDKIDTIEYDHLKWLSQRLISSMPESKLNELKDRVMSFETNEAKQTLFQQVD